MSLISYVEHLPPELENTMRMDLGSYETDQGIDVNYKPFALVLHDDDGHAIGVVNAYSAFAEIYVSDLWVSTLHRHKGYGKQLLETLFERFEGQGFNNINLCTSAFQAPQFYEKCGFHLEYIRKNHQNPKLNKYFYVKFFQNSVQTQGIITTKDTKPSNQP
ncbi:MAG: GNAT family N-acetyltransferase [Alphaproteobacteria bacterium]|nr:GNAT family N-acetyltransferase [Alphaproteobacteria bacterium]